MSPRAGVRSQRKFGVLAVILLVAWPAAVSSQACVGCTPLDDLAGPPYLGTVPLGLYAGGTNSPPAAHQALAQQAAAAVYPRDSSGLYDASGRIGVVTIGMSNTNQESAVFERLEDVRSARSARVVIVDCAVGGQSADVIVDPTASYWSIVTDRITAAGLDPDQVQIAWLKQADGQVPDTTFPAHTESLATHLRGIVRDLRDRYPNLQLCFLSSRIYGGYTNSPQRGEPLSYETAFAVRDLIAAQMSGDPTLNADPGAGVVESPVLLWGPYLWANGNVARASDGLVWLASDLESDGVHPAASGEAKVASLLGQFVGSDPSVTPWYLAGGDASLQWLDAEADAYVDTAQPNTNFGAVSDLAFSHLTRWSYVRFDLAPVAAAVQYAKLSLVTPADVATRPTQIVVVSDTGWDESTIAAATAPAFDGAVLGTIPTASRGSAVSLDVTSAVVAALAAPGRKLTLGIRSAPSAPTAQAYTSRETAQPPRLVLSVMDPATSTSPREESSESVNLTLAVAPLPLRTRSAIVLDIGRHSAAPQLDIFDARGARVRHFAADATVSSSRTWIWDGTDDAGRPVANGVYWLRGSAGPGAQTTRKIVVAR